LSYYINKWSSIYCYLYWLTFCLYWLTCCL